jgi:hypothetical protein
MIQESFPARLHVLVPANSESAIVIRRGPSKHTCVLSWNTRTDEVKPAQWLKGRIYERRSDISPDGKYWIYFAMNGHWDSEAMGSWTAIARAPWLKAIALFPKGDCWHGGGLFQDDRSYWLNDGYGHQSLTKTSEVVRAGPSKDLQYFGGECPTVYYNRLMRGGWTCMGEIINGRHDTRMIFERPCARGWSLRKICHAQVGSPKGRGCYWDEHSLVSPDGDETFKPDWEWADLVRGSIVFAAGGALSRTDISDKGAPKPASLIHDFNGYQFEQMEAPY